MKLQPLPVKTFTRDAPCTKVDLHNCFAGPGGAYRARAVVEARGIIGLNAIKYLTKNGYARAVLDAGVEYWQLTQAGRAWLTTGLKRHLELHPEDAGRVQHARPARTIRRAVKRV